MAKHTQMESTIQALANQFAAQVMEAIRTMSLGEIIAHHGGVAALAKSGGAGKASSGRAPSTKSVASPTKLPRVGKGQRRSAADIDATVSAILKVLKAAPEGLRAEQIRGKLGLTRKDIDLPIATALEEKKLKKVGERRATRYFAR